MIEAMEQQIINDINNRWRKNEKLRTEIDIDKTSEHFRVICSSRNSVLSLIDNLKIHGISNENLTVLEERLHSIYSWTTNDAIESIYAIYSKPIKDKKKLSKYLAEIPLIKQHLENFENELIELTIEKLFDFHKIVEVQ